MLFLGNSYTFVNDLPGTLHALAAAESPPVGIAVDSIAVASITLRQLYDRPDVHSRIAEGHFTHVVIQEQSVGALEAPADFHHVTQLFADEVRRSGATPVLYETWARREGNEVYKRSWSGGSPAAMQAGLDREYEAAAKETSALLARVGDARAIANVRVAEPLFVPDGSHPTPIATYLAACVFFRAITGRAATGARPPAEISADVAAKMQAIADEIQVVSRP